MKDFFYLSREKILIIAEIGINHNGNLSLAKKMIDAAAESGVDAVKFQAFKTKHMYSRNTNGFSHTNNDIFSQMEKLEIRDEWWDELKDHSKKNNLFFSCSVFDEESLSIISKTGTDFVKVASSEINNPNFIIKQKELSDTFIISTGMSYLSEIARTVFLLKKNNISKIALLECTSSYPAESRSIYLKNIEFLNTTFDLPVGFSDHTIGIHHAIAAAGLGARIIEKHFTIDKKLPGPDQKLSANTEEMKQLVSSIRDLEPALKGNRKAKISEHELQSRRIARKSVIARIPLKKGDLILRENTEIKRPGMGIPPMEAGFLYGRKTNQDIEADTCITWEMIESP
jgi:sialic acid synthase SpsE